MAVEFLPLSLLSRYSADPAAKKKKDNPAGNLISVRRIGETVDTKERISKKMSINFDPQL
jgi:hypothetical protein